ncbi:MAG: hypothetical protein DMG07_18880, partial [Acidobacteria bacterium]
MMKRSLIMLALVWFSVLCGALKAQTLDTAILGTVTDSTGGLVPGASMTVSQPATGFVRSAATNAEGYYEVRYLLPGNYT